VFAVRVIKIWNHKNLKPKPTVNQFLFFLNDRNRPRIRKWKPSQH